mmetsp:Transcript_12177/g.25680  ORF Transcript_12177/g.25680 Transcript_12177/m.25680 type:complete len:335 (-) Transcript_12177:86-1090(-)
MKTRSSFFFNAAPLVLFIGGVIATNEQSSDIGKSYRLYHTLGHGSGISPRGRISIAPPEHGEGLVATFYPEDSEELDITGFDGMVRNNALYTLIVAEDGDQAPSTRNIQLGNSRFVSASVPGCSVRRANLREEITLSIGPTGKLMGVSYRPLISPLTSKTCDKLKPLSEKPENIFGRIDGKDAESMPFKTTVAFESHKPMMAIPTVLPQSRPPPGLKWFKRNSKSDSNPAVGDVGEEQPSGFKSSFFVSILVYHLAFGDSESFWRCGGRAPHGGSTRCSRESFWGGTSGCCSGGSCCCCWRRRSEAEEGKKRLMTFSTTQLKQPEEISNGILHL